MKKIFYIVAFASLMFSCSDTELIDTPSAPDADKEVFIPANAQKGELLIKFRPELTNILDETMSRASRSGVTASRSGIPTTDEVLDILGGYHFERVFPVDKRTEERTRQAGLHLWYFVKFDENTDLKEAAKRLSRIGDITSIQCNHRIQRAQSNKDKRVYVSQKALQTPAANTSRAALPFTDPGLQLQWNLNNIGDYTFNKVNPSNSASAVAGCDVRAFDAWEKCKGDRSIIVAVLDEGVMYTHPDLKDNIWINEGEELFAGKDADGNGYKDDKYGYNFVTDNANITWNGRDDSGHGTHVAGIISATNGNNEGVCGIAGGSGNHDGVRIMAIQVFANGLGMSLASEARAFKYAADNGAVILQCSWGYNSAYANPMEGFIPGPATEKQWKETYPLEKEALDYFIDNAGSPNGVIEGGIAVFAAGNEFSGVPGYPGAYSRCISVAATDASFTPASYTNYGKEVRLSAPGGDTEYYGKSGQDSDILYIDDNNFDMSKAQGSILSTVIHNGKPSYGYMDGSSMACPTVSGVAALGLSYAAQLKKHFKQKDFIDIMLKSTQNMEEKWGSKKIYNRNHIGSSPSVSTMKLSEYKGKMGKGLIDAGKLLSSIGDEKNGLPMLLPNVYVGVGQTSHEISLPSYFQNGEKLTYKVAVENESVATAEVKGSMLTVKGVTNGFTKVTVTASDDTVQTLTVTVRKDANNDGWL